MKKLILLLSISFILNSCEKEPLENFFSDLHDTTWESVEYIDENNIKVFLSIKNNDVVTIGFVDMEGNYLSCGKFYTTTIKDEIPDLTVEIFENSNLKFSSKLSLDIDSYELHVRYFTLIKNGDTIKFTNSSSEDIIDESTNSFSVTLSKTTEDYESSINRCSTMNGNSN